MLVILNLKFLLRALYSFFCNVSLLKQDPLIGTIHLRIQNLQWSIVNFFQVGSPKKKTLKFHQTFMETIQNWNMLWRVIHKKCFSSRSWLTKTEVQVMSVITTSGSELNPSWHLNERKIIFSTYVPRPSSETIFKDHSLFMPWNYQ